MLNAVAGNSEAERGCHLHSAWPRMWP